MVNFIRKLHERIGLVAYLSYYNLPLFLPNFIKDRISLKVCKFDNQLQNKSSDKVIQLYDLKTGNSLTKSFRYYVLDQYKYIKIFIIINQQNIVDEFIRVKFYEILAILFLISLLHTKMNVISILIISFIILYPQLFKNNAKIDYQFLDYIINDSISNWMNFSKSKFQEYIKKF